MNSLNPNMYLNVGEQSEVIRNVVRTEMPSWLSTVLDDSLSALWRAYQASKQPDDVNRFSEEVQRQVRISETEQAHEELPAFLAKELSQPLPALIPDGASTYFNAFLDRVRFQIEAIGKEEELPNWLTVALDTEKQPELPAHATNYFSDFSDSLKSRIEVVGEEHPAWLNEVLQYGAYPEIPEGATSYFNTFLDNIQDTIFNIEVLEQMEAREPDTIERLVEQPDWFDLTMQDQDYLALPVGQELYFDDFSDRIKQTIQARGLDKTKSLKMPLYLHPQLQWAAAACIGFILGFILFG